jgi:D-methionine transport system substrate-binding protein
MRKNFKKALVGLVVTAAVIGLTGCGSKDSATESAKDTNAAATEATVEETQEKSDETEDKASNTDNTVSEEDKKVTVGVCAGPYGDMFADAIQPSLEELGYEVEIIEISDIVTPNTAVDEGEITLNVFQHSIYLNNFN